MKKALLQACAVCVGATGAYAGGLDRSGQGVNILFEEGSVVQFRLGYANPDVSGEQNGVDSGNIAKSFWTPHLAYKHSFTDQLDFALIYDEPYGADVEYPSNYPLSQNPLAAFGGRTDVLRAKADVDAITALVRYKFDGGFSAIGGIRAQRAKATVAVPVVAGYEFESGSEVDFGYVVGVAWERPEIAARVALTYNSKITHDFDSTESINRRPPPVPAPLVTAQTETEVVTPQSVNLDFQTGVAPKTLLFGSIRWVDWPQTVLAPPVYTAAAQQNLVDYADDTFTYTLGLGYKFTEEFSGAISAGYETSSGSAVSNLGPTDGFWSLGVGGTYSFEQAQISGGIRYTDIGDATTTTGGEFSGNSAWSVGLQLTYTLN
ncbi:OmpP1/FadL family transporter [Ruegeria atlantica]|uniref:Long-chain fatty acid outer membrane transporter n=1 Tax=Ruegeria atlantica TaxID=81569 RepID=A0A0P1EEB6_9RHOB|nr:outer membrane protein transport protein [Ruegeria atlantica]CUH48253.1 long-chain fatty acid outer membrane transporter [Ruegeria atlantica]